ncbi:hypothetical protein VTJ04DRAFT_2584 [Mycothermus thermophilus]|uniref:uncharacterized protein n=1 Tax=Humicola insolens TaxID=85995 RepID=UPI0037424459
MTGVLCGCGDVWTKKRGVGCRRQVGGGRLSRRWSSGEERSWRRGLPTDSVASAAGGRKCSAQADAAQADVFKVSWC